MRGSDLCLVIFPFPYAGMSRIRFEETLSAAQQFLKRLFFKKARHL